MTPHRLANFALAALICAAMSTSYLLDGPSELDAAQNVAESTQDAIESVAANAALERAEAHFCQNPTLIASN